MKVWLNMKIIALQLPSILILIVVIYNLYSISINKLPISIRIFLVMLLFKLGMSFSELNYGLLEYGLLENTVLFTAI